MMPGYTEVQIKTQLKAAYVDAKQRDWNRTYHTALL